jgi:tetratricopeptide (TPR) repeat protein
VAFNVILISILGLVIAGFIYFFLRSLLIPKRAENISDLIERGRHSLAIKLAKQILRKDPRNVNAHYLLGKAYLNEGKPELALMEYKTINEAGRFDKICQEVPFRKEIAALYGRFGQPEEALKEYILLMRAEPQSVAHVVQAGELFEKRGNSDRALELYHKAIQMDGEQSNAHCRLGYLLSRKNRSIEARAELELALKLDPEMFSAHYYLGKILKESAEYASALNCFEKAQRAPELKVKCLIERGICFISMKNLERGISELSRAVALTPLDLSPEALFGRYFLAHCYEKRRNLDRALEIWEAIYSKKPSFKDVAEKLSQYHGLRIDDRMKDYVTVSNDAFLKMCIGIVSGMDLEVRESGEKINGCQIVAAESESKWHSVRKMPRLIWFLRVSDMINEATVRSLLNEMRERNINRGIIFASSHFSHKAIEYAASRSIELCDREALQKQLQGLASQGKKGPATNPTRRSASKA